MRLDRLAALAAAVDRPQGRSLVRAAACRWALDADPARYVRTSATCVYAVGGGYLRLMRFDPGARKVAVRTYSPFAGRYKTEPDNLPEISRSTNEFVGFLLSGP